ncbi:reverse transcriptase domain-containing protein [Tanacetum coccineum]
MRTRRSNYPNNSNVTIPRRQRKQVSNIVEPEIRTIVEMAERIMEELLQAPTEGYGEAIVLPEINVDHFEIKTNLLQLVQANPFYGRESENPHAHINSFKRITSTLRFRNVPNDVIKLMMFPYSLEGAAKTWYEKEPPNSILTWEDLVTKFVNQFFPPSKTTHLKNEISRFTQKIEETFSEAWERFKELLRACPHHGFMELTQVDTFYNGLNESEQDSLNAAAGGNLLSKTTREALNIIENKSKVHYSRNRSNASRMNATSSKTDERINKLADQLLTLVEIVSKKVVTFAPVKAVEETCVTCSGSHSWYNCPATDNNQANFCCSKMGLKDKILVPKPPQNCATCGDPVDGLYCRSCAFVRKCLNEAFLKEYDHIPPNEKCMALLLAEERFLKIKQAIEEEQNQPEVMQELLLKLMNDLQILKGSQQEKKETKFSRIPFGVTPKVILIAWESFGKIKDALTDEQYRQEDIQELMSKLLEDVRNISEELSEYINCPSWNRPTIFNDDDEYTIIYSKPKAITPDLPIEEPDNSLIMGDEHLDTIPSVENLVPIPSEFEGISEDTCDVPVCEDPSTFDALSNHSEILSDSNNDGTSSDDDSYENIEYVEASPLNLEIIILEEVNKDQEEKDFNLEDIFQIQDVTLREKLVNISRLITNIESLKDNPTHDHVFKSPSLVPIYVTDSDSFFEESDTSLSHLDNSLPEFKTFSDHTEETRSGSTTTHANNSLPEYDSFLFEVEPDQGGLISIVISDNSNDPLLELPEFESFHFDLYDDPSFPRPPPEPPDVEISLIIETDAPVINNFDELNEDECFDPGGGEINVEVDDSFTFVTRTFLPYLTYPEVSPLLSSTKNEDTIFDPDIST